jgi:hypothetical protein
LSLLAETEKAEATVFRIQLDADLVQPLLILAERDGRLPRI